MIIRITQKTISLFRDSRRTVELLDSFGFETISDIEMTQIDNHIAPGEEIIVLLGGDYAFTKNLQTDHQVRRNERSIAYAVEEYLPLTAEQIEAGYIEGSDLIVAFNDNRLLSWIEALGSRFDVVFAGYQSLLALEYLIDSRSIPSSGSVLLVSDDEWNLFQIKSGKVSGWNWSPTSAGINAQFRSLEPDSPTVVVGDSGVTLDGIEMAVDDRRSAEQTVMGIATERARNVAAGRKTHWLSIPCIPSIRTIDLDRPVAMALYCAAIMFFAVSFFFHQKSLQITNDASTVEESINQVFRIAVPDGRPGPLLERAMRMRLQAYESLQVKSEEAVAAPVVNRELERLLTDLPSGDGYSIDEIRVTPTGVEISGIHFDAEQFPAFATRMKSKGYQENNPRANRNRSGSTRPFSFRSPLIAGEAQP